MEADRQLLRERVSGRSMSAIGGKADMPFSTANVRF